MPEQTALGETTNTCMELKINVISAAANKTAMYLCYEPYLAACSRWLKRAMTLHLRAFCLCNSHQIWRHSVYIKRGALSGDKVDCMGKQVPISRY